MGGTGQLSSLISAWQERGSQAMLEVVRSAGEGQHHMEVRWVWFDAGPDDPHRPAAFDGRRIDLGQPAGYE